MEELEQALQEFGMQDGRDIKEIVSEVDGDNVSEVIRSLIIFTCKENIHYSIHCFPLFRMVGSTTKNLWL